MSQIAYTVACSFSRPEVAEGWLAWLSEKHLADVCAGGAVEARVVRMDGEPLRYEVRYLFASRDAFDAYLRDHAPGLKAEGLEKFPLDLGLAYQRTVGETVQHFRP